MSDEGRRDLCEDGGNCLKYLERGWNRTEGRGHEDFKKVGQAGSRGGCLKKGGLESPYELCAYSNLALNVYSILYASQLFFL